MIRSGTTALAASVFAAFIAVPAAAATTVQSDTTLTREVLAEGVYLFRAPSALDRWTATNSVVIVNDEDVTVFDSHTRARTARLVIDAIQRITSKPVRTLINSHWHQDHWSGNAEYVKAYPGVRIIATTETRDYMRRMSGPFFADGLDRAAGGARAALDSAIRTGRRTDGSALTADMRSAMEREVIGTEAFAAEVRAVPRVFPDIAYRDSLILWSGRREFRLVSVTGDATGSTVLYLPSEKILVMGDVLVRPETGDGPPPWTTNSYSITPWRNALRDLSRLDAAVIVPGQGAALRDAGYLQLTADLFTAIIDQVHAALERGIVSLADVQAVVNVDSLGRRYTPGSPAMAERFPRLVEALVRKVHQESLDGVQRP